MKKETEVSKKELMEKVTVALAEFISRAASEKATPQEVEVLASVANSFITAWGNVY